MSALLTAAPIEATIGGVTMLIPPATLYEIGVCESSYIASLRRQAIESTMGLGAEERQMALNALSQYAGQLGDDISPLFDWLAYSIEGQVKLLVVCIEAGTGNRVLPRDVATWIHESGGNQYGSPFYEWMVRSGLRRNPVGESVKPEPTSATGEQNASGEPSSDGATA